MSFEEKLNLWINLDNKIKVMNENIKQLKEQRDTLENEITLFSKENNLVNSFIKINDNKVKIINTKISEPITFKYLEKSLADIINNQEQIQLIIQHLKDNRQNKIIQEIKRYNNNNK